MLRVVKKVVLVVAVLLGLAFAFFSYTFHADQERFRAATNPCERACIQDSGGVLSCRKECASHPMTYGPASQQLPH